MDFSIRDFKKALVLHRIWIHLGMLEVKQRYRRSIIGPWWISISMLIFITIMGIIFSRLFGQNLDQYIPFFASGFLLWSFISGCLNESADVFKSNCNFIKQVNLPFNLYIFKFLVRNLMILGHNFAVYLLVVCFFKLNPGWKVLIALPGLALLLLNLYWICMLVALVSTRYRDLVSIVNNAVQILFFVTPISWMPKLLGEDSIIVKFNPMVYFLDVVRLPLLGYYPSSLAWIVNISLGIFGLSMSILIFNAVRYRIPFWVD